MARAPRPGVGKRKEQTASAKRVLTIRINDDEPVTLAPDLVTIQERLIVRKATGIPFDAFTVEDRIGTDTIMVLWWLGRRAHGEPFLSFDDAARQFPEDLNNTRWSVVVDEPDMPALETSGAEVPADDPESSGPDS